jgi:AcrR family transcriptional regulator
MAGISRKKTAARKTTKKVTARRQTSQQAIKNPRKALVRDRLLEKAAELFCSNGYARTSINDIADSLDLKRSSIYHYFSNKEEMISALFDEESTRRCNSILELLEQQDLTPTERLIRAVTEGIVLRLRAGSRFLVFDRLEAEVPEDVRKSYNRSRRQILDLYSRMIADGVKAGEFRDVDVQMAAFAVIGMSNWTALWYSPSGSKTPAEIAKILVDIVIHGLNRHDGSRQTPRTMAAAIQTLKDDVEILERLADFENISN